MSSLLSHFYLNVYLRLFNVGLSFRDKLKLLHLRYREHIRVKNGINLDYVIYLNNPVQILIQTVSLLVNYQYSSGQAEVNPKT